MSSRAMVEVRFIELTNMTDKFTLITLAELVDDTGVTFRDQAYIAQIMCASRETVNRSLKRLEEAGLVSREARWDDETHQQKSSILRVILSHTEPKSRVTESHTEAPKPCDGESQSRVTESHSLKDNLTTKQERTSEPAAEVGPKQASDGALFSVGDDSEQYRPLCLRLAGHVEANLGTKVTVKKNWLDACRRMLIVDERDPQQAEALMDWALTEPFWMERIQSMDSFRKHYVSAYGQFQKVAKVQAQTSKEAEFWKKGVH